MEKLEIKGDLLLLVHAGGHEYPIELNRFDTYEKILSWALQLSEKSWMTTIDLNTVINKMLSHHDLAYPQA